MDSNTPENLPDPPGNKSYHASGESRHCNMEPNSGLDGTTTVLPSDLLVIRSAATTSSHMLHAHALNFFMTCFFNSFL